MNIMRLRDLRIYKKVGSLTPKEAEELAIMERSFREMIMAKVCMKMMESRTAVRKAA